MQDDATDVTPVAGGGSPGTDEARAGEAYRAQRAALLAALLPGIAHEINNPNHSVMMNAAVLGGAWEGAQRVLDLYYEEHGDFEIGGLDYSEMREEIPALCRGIDRGAQKIGEVVGALRDFAREEPTEKSEPLDLNDCIRTAVLLCSNLTTKATARFSVQCAEGLPRIAGSGQQLTQMALNLIRNACAALPGPDCAVRVETSTGTDPAAVTLVVAGEGAGEAGEDLSGLADADGATRHDAGAAAVALAVTAGIVQKHGGTLRLVSSPGGGTMAVAVFPVAAG